MTRRESFFHGTTVDPDQMGGHVKPPGGWENLNSIMSFTDRSGGTREIVPHDPPEVRDANVEELRVANPVGYEWAMKQVNEGRPAYAARSSDDAWRWAGTKAGKTGTPYVYEVEAAPDTEPDPAQPDDWVLSEGGFKVTGVNNTKPPMVNNWRMHMDMMAGQESERAARASQASNRRDEFATDLGDTSTLVNPSESELDALLGL